MRVRGAEGQQACSSGRKRNRKARGPAREAGPLLHAHASPGSLTRLAQQTLSFLQSHASWQEGGMSHAARSGESSRPSQIPPSNFGNQFTRSPRQAEARTHLEDAPRKLRRLIGCTHGCASVQSNTGAAASSWPRDASSKSEPLHRVAANCKNMITYNAR